jgi:hypothetical protein
MENQHRKRDVREVLPEPLVGTNQFRHGLGSAQSTSRDEARRVEDHYPGSVDWNSSVPMSWWRGRDLLQNLRTLAEATGADTQT